MTDILEKIKSYKLEEINHRRKLVTLLELEQRAKEAESPRGFIKALNTKAGMKLIAEIKKASPSRGLIRDDFNPAELAAAYAEGGAACLSVLTDGPSFMGDDRYLIAAKKSVNLPILRKDFVFDIYQIVESRALGADCILLILAALEDNEAEELEACAISLGMDVLIETHNREEVERALRMRSKLIGINNRNLRTFETSLEVTHTLAPLVDEGRDIVSESGLFTHRDLCDLAEIGVTRFLIGESLMRKSDVTTATKEILGV